MPASASAGHVWRFHRVGRCVCPASECRFVPQAALRAWANIWGEYSENTFASPVGPAYPGISLRERCHQIRKKCWNRPRRFWWITSGYIAAFPDLIRFCLPARNRLTVPDRDSRLWLLPDYHHSGILKIFYIKIKHLGGIPCRPRLMIRQPDAVSAWLQRTIPQKPCCFTDRFPGLARITPAACAGTE